MADEACAVGAVAGVMWNDDLGEPRVVLEQAEERRHAVVGPVDLDRVDRSGDRLPGLGLLVLDRVLRALGVDALDIHARASGQPAEHVVKVGGAAGAAAQLVETLGFRFSMSVIRP